MHLRSLSVAMVRKLLVSAFVLCSGTACAGTPQEGDLVDLHGTLTLRGNEPFTYPVVSDGKKVWQLEGVDPKVLTRLQTHVVHVKGRVIADAVPSGLPAVQVDSVTIDEDTTP